MGAPVGIVLRTPYPVPDTKGRQHLARTPTAEPPTQVELSRLTVDPAVAERLNSLVERTGASGAWHRRKALAAYLDAQEA